LRDETHTPSCSLYLFGTDPTHELQNVAFGTYLIDTGSFLNNGNLSGSSLPKPLSVPINGSKRRMNKINRFILIRVNLA
jgi:hypothetical protein